MAQTTGFRFRGKGDKTAVCNDCISSLNLNKNGEALDENQIANEFCVVCGDNITDFGTIQDYDKHEIDYPLGICILVDSQFQGAHPVIDATENVKQINDAVKLSVAQRTQHDPVLVKVWPDQTQLLDRLQQFADNASQLGPIRGYTETYTEGDTDSEDGEVTGYDVFFFAKQ